MRIAPIPMNEDLRLKDLYSYEILDSKEEKDFDDLMHLVAQLCGCPIVNINFVDKDRVILKAKMGIDPSFTVAPRDTSFCPHTILEKELLIVEDTLLDERFNDNPNVTGGIKIRFYAGAPIVSKAGYKIGSVCVIDNRPRQINAAQINALTIISQQIGRLLELRVKNKLLKKKAEEQLQLEKELLLKTLNEHEKEIFSISTELHENIAQSLAATKFYLEMAEEADAGKDDLIKKSKLHVLDILQQVRSLSSSLSPTTMKDLDLKDAVKNMASDFYNRYAIETKLAYEGKKVVDPTIALAVYRIVEEHFNYIKQHAGVTELVIEIKANENLLLTIESNGGQSDDAGNKKRFYKIQSRVSALHGQARLAKNEAGGCRLSVSLPSTFQLELN